MTTHQQVLVDLTDVLRLVRSVNVEFPWAEGVGYVKDQGQTERVKGAGVADPTSQIVTSTWHSVARGRISDAAKAVARARSELIRAEKLLRSNVGGRPGTREEGAPNWECIGRRIAKGEFEEAVAAAGAATRAGEVAV